MDEIEFNFDILDKTIKIRNLQTGELENTLTGHNDLVYAVGD
ncbi:hypothetical protein [Fischerella thermalis]|jgi:WD40 repeat protein|uniref:Uncharacterized protein n=1 Tax=Fischerella thermalis JSC-11 TaxID=741277 RepID=G6FSG9_9CYAN|nr:hypothetical protein [Fischerella thermalis]EHC14805.1 hypothetical protein FJSC11DRAFT_1716 [Fischerella thermalis JSC-11]